MEKVSEKLLDEVSKMINLALVQQKIADMKSELQDLTAEMDWIPEMLEASQSSEAETAYFLMFQTHVAAFKSRIFKGDCAATAWKYHKGFPMSHGFSIGVFPSTLERGNSLGFNTVKTGPGQASPKPWVSSYLTCTWKPWKR